jgi:hypothetical protein
LIRQQARKYGLLKMNNVIDENFPFHDLKIRKGVSSVKEIGASRKTGHKLLDVNGVYFGLKQSMSMTNSTCLLSGS